jgi:hypothetical protein
LRIIYGDPIVEIVSPLLVQYTASGFFAFAWIPFIVVPVSWTRPVTKNFQSLLRCKLERVHQSGAFLCGKYLLRYATSLADFILEVGYKETVFAALRQEFVFRYTMLPR